MKVRMSKNNRNGFTMVELLVVVVILGVVSVIGIASVSNLIKKAHEDQKVQQEKTVAMAAESYLQANSNALPKAIGESKTIKLSDLKKSNYIQEDIENSDGESCMKNSYIRVYKYSKSKYTYSPYLYCGKEKAPATVTVPEPNIDIKFFYVDGDGKEHIDDKAVTNNVGNAHVRITLKGGKNTDGTALLLDGYNYSVLVQKKNDPTLQEVYDSGTLSANYESNVVIEKYLSDYIDLESVTSFVVRVSARNTAGASIDTEKVLGEKNVTYQDNIPPTCSDITKEAKGDDDWKIDPKDARVITLNCNDGDGSGCLRNSFSKTWPNKQEPEAEYSWIMVEDNAGNKNLKNCNHGDVGCCKVRVNVDYTSPTVSIHAYQKEKGDVISNTNILQRNSGSSTKGWKTQKDFEATDRDTKYVINSDDYIGLMNGWFNRKKSPYGIVYKVDIKDTVHLYRWEWNVNAANTKQNSSLGKGSETASGYFDSSKPTSSQTIYVYFRDDGYRHGKLKVYDRAGNTTEIDIYANIDRVAPSVPNLDDSNQVHVYKSEENGSKNHGDYKYDTWSTYYLKAVFNNKSIYDGDNSNKLILSGAAHYLYTFQAQDGKVVNGNTIDSLSMMMLKQGKGTFQASACDKAGNCSESSPQKVIKIDTIAPICEVWGGNKEWTNQTRTITAHCKSDGTYGSGCATDDFHFDYKYQIDTSYAGAAGDRKGGIIRDVAGNETNCDANQTVKIDKTPPTCTVTGGSTNWISSKTKDKSRVITATCSDKGGSGCDTPTSFHKEYSDDMNITNAGAVGVGNGGSFKDVAGNETNCDANQTVKIDKTPPACPTITSSTPSGVWTGSNIQYTFQFTNDTAKYKWYTNDVNTGEWVDWGEKSNATTTVAISGAGVRKVGVVVFDSLGNESYKCGSDLNYYIDKTGPTITCSVSNRNVSNVSVTDSQSGANPSSYQYQFSSATTTPAASNSYWGTSTNTGAGSACGTTYYGYVKAIDYVGNITVKYCGSYATSSCCSKSNPAGCDWVTACRYGTTNIYAGQGMTNWAGAVCHSYWDKSWTDSCHYNGSVPYCFWNSGSGSCSGETRLYLYNGNKISSGTYTAVAYLGGNGGSRVSPGSGSGWKYGYIQNKCIGSKNQTCPYSSCPG